MNSINVHGKTWFDSVNGNSYFSARVEIDGVEVARLPFQYGYGDQYLYEALEALKKLELIPQDAGSLFRFANENKIALYRVLETSLKRDVTGWGKEWKSTK